MTAFFIHFRFDFSTGLRNPSQLLMNYLFPLVFYGMMGLVMTQINPAFKDLIVPAMVVFATLTTAVLGMPGPAVQAREAGIYRSYKINGVPALSILAMPALTALFHALIVALVITLTATPFFGGVAPLHWSPFVLVTVLTVFACAGLGSLIGVVSRGAQATVLLSQLIFLPSMLLGGLMMPSSVLPASVRGIAALLPATHAMQAYLGLAYGQPTAVDPLLSAFLLLAGGLLAFGAAICLFQWDNNQWDNNNATRRVRPVLALVVLAPYALSIFLQ